ncbi:hypothetical protein [Paenarthrobacter sp. NPDC091669]|uniref:hypothetical protein n=1 Tax=Paenarthrobacter sp. NPDC091669 TaxID=3364384 RepID=UPI0037FA763A
MFSSTPGLVRATDVFGVSRELPMNYVTRPAVDDEFVASLTRDKHVIVYGSSKQGKTSLRKFHLKPDEYQVVTCSNKQNLSQLNTAILKQAGFEVEMSRTRTETGSAKITAKATLKATLFGKGVEGGLEASGDKGHSDSVASKPLELDPADVNEVIGALESIGFNRWIVLEDFHYLPEATQRDFAIALKAFHENSSLVFIIVGVWLQQNRLVQFNGDLAGRIATVNADAWTREELFEAITIGEQHLNVRFEESFVSALLDGSNDSIHVVQESCLHACEKAGVNLRSDGTPPVIQGDAQQILRVVVDAQSGRYSEFLVNFAGGFGETEFEMYKWLLLPVIMAPPEQLERGLAYRWLRKRIDRHHPKKPVNAGSVSQALKSVASLQVKHGITPLVLDYDSALKKLNVVDRSFLIWLRQQDPEELLEGIDLPGSIVEEWEQAEAEEEE